MYDRTRTVTILEKLEEWARASLNDAFVYAPYTFAVDMGDCVPHEPLVLTDMGWYHKPLDGSAERLDPAMQAHEEILRQLSLGLLNEDLEGYCRRMGVPFPNDIFD